ncbi:MAG TPA: FTR1 family protein, partial [Candidatus Acidoferrales bacterium]|nr:FTR1 family protein [Candidatus Acidoferrales bacterium]
MILASVVGVTSVAAAANREERVQRLLTLLAAIGEEYREGVRDGVIVRPIEFEEARTFLADAGDLAGSVAPSQTPLLQPQFAAVGKAIDDHVEPALVAEKLEALRQHVMTLTGIAEEIYPPNAPSAARGRQLFGEYCTSCHGERGDGKGRDAADLKPPPADFTDPQFMRGETPYDFVHVISLGKHGTAMAAWDEVLNLQDRWDVVSDLWMLRHSRAEIAEGQGIYLSQCASCHGVSGDGKGSYSAALLSHPNDLTQPQSIAQRSDADLFAASRDGVAGTPMPAFAHSLSDDERWKAVAYLRALSLGGPPTDSNAPSSAGSSHPQGAPGATASLASVDAVDQALRKSADLVGNALAAYARGDSSAVGLAADAYFEFEPVETKLGAVNPDLKTTIEERFLHLRQMLRAPDKSSDLEQIAGGIRSDFDSVRAALQPQASSYGLFLQSGGIILREGFEVVLVIGALLAYVAKAGSAALKRAVHAGTLLGVVASLATGFLMGELLHAYPGSSEILEGFTMLLAATVLFWVSYWLISKTEAEKWQRYIRGKVQQAITRRSSVALAGAAFLAVYREGFETVLFYQALFGSAPHATATLASGLLAGTVALVGVTVLIRYFQVQIPLQQFFFVTGIFLYMMAAIFAGQGIHELQEVGLLGNTHVAWVPTLPL